MTKVALSIQGPQAVGKTTVLKNIEKELNQHGIKIVFEKPSDLVKRRNGMKLNLGKMDDFITNQRLFIENEIKTYNSYANDIIVYDRGPEDTECYTVNYPIIIAQEWDIGKLMEQDLIELRKCKINRILYLSLQDSELISRKQNDRTRQRKSFELQAFKIYEHWYQSKTNVDFTSIHGLSIYETERMVKDWIINQIEIAQQGDALDPTSPAKMK